MSNEKNLNQVTVRVRVYYRLFITILLIYSVYFLAETLGAGNTQSLKEQTLDWFTLVVFLIFAYVVWTSRFIINKEGITQIVGYKIGSIQLGWKITKKWKQLQVRYYDFWLLPAIAVETSKAPRFWKFLFTNFDECAALIGKYGMGQILTETDRQIFRKYIEKVGKKNG
jgi:hypothetical protein